jgi:hypothetical protein
MPFAHLPVAQVLAMSGARTKAIIAAHEAIIEPCLFPSLML